MKERFDDESQAIDPGPHVPPFREASWHQGRISDDDWLPHFTCKAVGDVLREAMVAHCGLAEA